MNGLFYIILIKIGVGIALYKWIVYFWKILT